MRRTLFAVIGCISIILSIVCFTKDTGDSIWRESYGGDAFTGIQNAGAKTGNNVLELAEITRFGFGSILLISGMVLISLAIPCDEKKKNKMVDNKETTEEEPKIVVEETEASE